MKNLFLLLLVCFHARQALASQVLIVLDGGQLTSFGVQSDGPKQVILSADWNLKWVRSQDHIACVEEFSHDAGDRCRLTVTQKNSLRINGYSLPLPDDLITLEYKWRDFVTSQTLTNLKAQAQPEASEHDLIELTDVQRSTRFTRDGSCYTKELRFFADDATKGISKMWFEEVAAGCP